MPARPRPEPDPLRATVTVLEPQGERRRRQLIEVAARLIEEEGPDAVRIPRVAELAGVGRTAIYRYFQRREDLLAAVLDDFDQRLSERIEELEFGEGLLALARADPDALPASTAHLFAVIWDLLEEGGPAGLILRANAAVHEEGGPEGHTTDRFGAPWLSLGLSELHATLIGDAANALLTRLFFRARRGEIDREEAIRISYRALVALVRGLRED
jgi:AcrR family transcriptional regulator